MRSIRKAIVPCAVCIMLAVALCGCGGAGPSDAAPAARTQETSGPAFSVPDSVASAEFTGVTQGTVAAGIDASSLSDGYVGATAQSANPLKLVIECGGVAFNYDLPNDGTPLIAPLNMGDGTYTFSIMQNTSGNRYVEVFSTVQNVAMADEFAPFLHPNVFCNYGEGSAAVLKATELAEGAQNEGDVLAAIYDYVVDNIVYDSEKARSLAGTSGYIPDPDETLRTGRGICFDYASLMAAMLRSQGIPCKIITGYVSPDDVYHAWNMVYIDGTWRTISFTVNPNDWTRLDTTFAASDPSSTIGDGNTYTDRYVY